MQQQANQQYIDYDEISLRELIETLLKGWKLIALITVVCLLVSAIFSFVVLEPTYEAKSVLMASFASDKLSSVQRNGEDIEGILDTISAYPVMTIQTYQEQITTTKILQQVVDELDLSEKEITRNDLKNMITLGNISNTNLIEIKVKHNDPELAAEIANTLTQKFTEFVTELSKEQSNKSSQFLASQLELEKQKLNEAQLELKELLEQPRGASELRAEFDSKLGLLTTHKTQLVEKEVELSKLKAGLEAAETELKNTPQILVTYKSVGEDSLLGQIVAEENDASITDTAKLTMKNEEINESYVEIATKVSEYKTLVAEAAEELNMIKNNIDSSQRELEALQAELADKEHQLTLVQRNVDLAQGTYDAFLKKYEEVRIAGATEAGESNISIVAKAPVPMIPVAPNKMLNLAIAGVLGVMLGMFIVFFKAYWEKSAVEAK